MSLLGGSPSIPTPPGYEAFHTFPANPKLARGEGGKNDPGWKVTRSEGKVTLGGGHTLAMFDSPTRDKLLSTCGDQKQRGLSQFSTVKRTQSSSERLFM